MRKTCQLVLASLLAALPSATLAQDHPTGLQVLDRQQYNLLPRAKAPVGGSLPDSFTLENYFPPAQDQGHSNACAAFAVTMNKAYRIYMASGQKGAPDQYLQSPGFPYSAACQRRSKSNLPLCTDGTFITDELDFLWQIGSLPLDQMKFRENVCENWSGARTRAANKSISPYRTLPPPPQAVEALTLMKNLIVAGNPIIAGINACQEFHHPTDGKIGKYDPNDTQCGAHAILVVGFDDRPGLRAVRILNSWGDGNTWNGSDNGKVWMPYKTFMARYLEGYVDDGPSGVASYGGSYEELAQSPIGATPSASAVSPSLTLSPEILEAALRSNIAERIGRKKVFDPDDNEWHTINQRYLWLDLPAQYATQVKSVKWTLDDPSFHPWTITKEKSTIFLAGWIGYNCVDEATVEATLSDPKLHDGPVVTHFNYCEIEKKQEHMKQ
jgi:hypothetical protein